jgi:DNA-binding CsgD family transcriptional regulator
MSSELVLVSQNHKGGVQGLYLDDGRFVLGRSSDCDFIIDHRTVSRHHAEIVVLDGTAAIRDLGSRNGTYVNGDRACDGQTVLPGDRVSIGNVLLVLKLRPASNPAVDSAIETEECSDTQFDPSVIVAKLSPAHKRVLQGLLKGLHNKQIARELGISSNTVHLHAQAIYRLLRVHSRSELLAALLPLGVVDTSGGANTQPSTKTQSTVKELDNRRAPPAKSTTQRLRKIGK